ncbi:UPF0223 family protein [Secundilactobacillus folii]|uniref:Uncharacterized protein n=1 Tax=Secundilactobacillus folii TaxID=2678357 RepID=A0A7X3C2D3_9LACO|nr:UPF0223 family protein [Secundilactobacillus folii]MTV81362.1 hypothetical protein [Secundilactobacillus folii]
MKNISYPLASDWTTEEIITVTAFYRQIENAYELAQGVSVADLLTAYAAFKKIVTSKSQEKQLDKQFEQATGYSWYHALKEARATNKKSLKMVPRGRYNERS